MGDQFRAGGAGGAGPAGPGGPGDWGGGAGDDGPGPLPATASDIERDRAEHAYQSQVAAAVGSAAAVAEIAWAWGTSRWQVDRWLTVAEATGPDPDHPGGPDTADDGADVDHADHDGGERVRDGGPDDQADRHDTDELDGCAQVAGGGVRLPLTAAAVATGRLDWAKADVLVRMLAHLSPGAAGRVEARVVPQALTPVPDLEGRQVGLIDVPVRTVPGLRQAINTAILELAADEARQHARARRAGRHVSFEAIDEVLGLLRAELPLEDLARVKALLDNAVLAAKTDPDEGRTAGEIRADVLVDLIVSDTVPGLRAHLMDMTERVTGTPPAEPADTPEPEPEPESERAERDPEREPERPPRRWA